MHQRLRIPWTQIPVAGVELEHMAPRDRVAPKLESTGARCASTFGTYDGIAKNETKRTYLFSVR